MQYPRFTEAIAVTLHGALVSPWPFVYATHHLPVERTNVWRRSKKPWRAWFRIRCSLGSGMSRWRFFRRSARKRFGRRRRSKYEEATSKVQAINWTAQARSLEPPSEPSCYPKSPRPAPFCRYCQLTQSDTDLVNLCLPVYTPLAADMSSHS